ncbi:MAG: glycosyltransferase family 39 protein [Bacteroidetes bacterium]|nr:glycosyltransferase family 39 protein [Bacteroidota bacterium]
MSTPTYQHTKRQVLWLISIATLVKLFLATQLELGNDEVYYWTYALYPDWSHFDHPPMVGILAQLFSLNLFLKNDFFLRLGPIVLAAASTWFIFLIGTKIKNEKTGLYAAFLFTGSIYGSVISGFALTPDAPLIFFWLLAMKLMFDFLLSKQITSFERKRILWFGLVAGLAMLSKYQGAFLWVAVFICVLFFNRAWLKEISFWLAGIISALTLLSLVIWNVQNDFISFTFHTARVAPAWEFRLDYFLTEILGQVAYNNPINYVLIVIAFIAIVKKKIFIQPEYLRILLTVAFPLWIVFTGFSVFRSTLPHWTAPAFLPFILLAAAYWSDQPEKKFFWVKAPVFFLAGLLSIALWLINYSPLQVGKKSSVENFGEDDFTQDMYGCDQIENAFKQISDREEKNGSMPKQSDIVSYQWFPGAHLDFYVAQPNHRKLFLLGETNDIHKYAWINNYRGGLQQGKDYYLIQVSNVFKSNEVFLNYFERIEAIDTVEIKRADKIMRYAFFYRLKNYKGNFVNPVSTYTK